MAQSAEQSLVLANPQKWREGIQKFESAKYLVLAPLELGPIPAMHTPMASVVRIDPAPDQGDVYELQGKFAYSKAALDRISAAAGISWLPEMCGRTDSGQDPEIVRFRMAGKRKELDGQWRVVVREYEFDLKAREQELWDTIPKREWITKIADKAKRDKAIAETVAKDMVQLRKFKVQRAESGAANRVVRVFLGIKAHYTREQIARPVVVPKLVFTPDYSDPEVKRFMLAEATGTIPELYASQATHGSYSHPIVIPETPAELAEIEPAKAIIAGEPENGNPPPGPSNASEGERPPLASPPPPDAVTLFQEAFAQEAAGGTNEIKAAAVADQFRALESLMVRKGRRADTLKKPLAQFTRAERQGFFEHLQKQPDAQAALPWDNQ